MFINPKVAISEGWIAGINNLDTQLQPNAIDFTLDRLFSINHHSSFHISEEGKQMRGGNEIAPLADRRAGIDYWRLESNSVYDGMSNIHVTLPEGVAAILLVRSTFNRNGIFITSGLYDQGYQGSLGFAVHNRSGVAFISPGTRIGQVIFVKSDDSGILYAGGYNTENGQHWSEAT